MKLRDITVKKDSVHIKCQVTFDEVLKEFVSRMDYIRDMIFESIDNGCEDCFDDFCNEFIAFVVISEMLDDLIKSNDIDVLASYNYLDFDVYRRKVDE